LALDRRSTVAPTGDLQSAAALLRIICLGALLGIGGLYLYGSKKINPKDFALRREDVRAHENWNGKQITATSLPEMQRVVNDIGGEPQEAVLWLGNSQLHTINQPQRDDHLAPYWLKAAGGLPEGTIPLGFSLPNSNLQGYFAIAAAVLGRVPVRAGSRSRFRRLARRRPSERLCQLPCETGSHGTFALPDRQRHARPSCGAAFG
jgi:hypothetical protein